MKVSRIVWIGVVILLLAGGGYYLYTRQQTAQAAAQSAYDTEVAKKGDLTATVGATGTVRANQTVTLNWQTTGQVSKISVQLDQKVEKDQVLAELDPGSLPQNVILARADLVNAQRALDNLKTSTSAQTQAQLAVVQARKGLDDAKQHRLNLDYRSTPDQIAAANANYILAQDEVDRLQGYYDTVTSRPEDDPARALALANLENAKKKRDKALINLNWYKGKADPKDIAEADANVSVAQSRLEDAQREYERLRNGADPQDIAAAEAKVDAIQATLDTAYIKAPFAGSMTAVNVMVGDQASGELSSAGPAGGAGSASSATASYAFRIDDLSRLLVDVPVSEVDINRIEVGQPVTLTFDAIPEKSYNGKVTEVARVGQTVQGGVNFTVTVELTDADDAVRPGMTAAVNIVATQLHDVLLVPNRAVRVRNGKRVVYLLKNNQASAVDITIGATSDTYSQLIGGDVHEDDAIILNPPAE
ncbi:MAG TPA: efflux RND transporter periplasmic adaptor subunit, partial [Anaerolineaceae bacterium]|nr:efflux RND transporter periplasmic adaptor subunit [Anaerolineaceae bacterium]